MGIELKKWTRKNVLWPIFVGLFSIYCNVAHTLDVDEQLKDAKGPGLASNLSAPKSQAGEQDLKQAYQKEFAILTAQKRHLKQRVEEQKSYYEKYIKDLNQKYLKAQDLYLRLNADLEKKENIFQELNKSLEQLDDKKSQLENTFLQASTSLEIKWDESLNVEQKLELIATKAMEELIQGHLVVVKDGGQYFDQSGQSVQGKILSLGRIASYGISQNNAGPLIPVGGQQMKLLSSMKADDLFNAFKPRTDSSSLLIPMYLYENTKQGIETKKTQSLFEFIHSGGMVAWIIVFMGLFALGLLVLRSWLLYKDQKIDQQQFHQIKNLVAQGSWQEAQNACDQSSPLGRLCLKVLSENDPVTLEEKVNEQLIKEELSLDRFSTLILVMAAIAPLMGLLGTVTGMISTFDIITEFGTGDPKMLSGGISEALITTELGLIVAIPALFFGNVLSAQAKKIKMGLEHYILDLVTFKKDSSKGGF